MGVPLVILPTVHDTLIKTRKTNRVSTIMSCLGSGKIRCDDFWHTHTHTQVNRVAKRSAPRNSTLPCSLFISSQWEVGTTTTTTTTQLPTSQTNTTDQQPQAQHTITNNHQEQQLETWEHKPSNAINLKVLKNYQIYYQSPPAAKTTIEKEEEPPHNQHPGHKHQF